jgi:hypothetical protein
MLRSKNGERNYETHSDRAAKKNTDSTVTNNNHAVTEKALHILIVQKKLYDI